MGSGSDTFQWDPGDGSDTIEGDSGTDTMLFNGANVAERIELSANGNRLRFTRESANIVMDTDSVERVVFNALGGAGHRHGQRPQRHRCDAGRRRPRSGRRRHDNAVDQVSSTERPATTPSASAGTRPP